MNYNWFKNLFSVNKDRLRREAIGRANELFNIIDLGGHSYLMFDGVQISTDAEVADPAELLERMYELRRVYVEKYVERNGRY